MEGYRLTTRGKVALAVIIALLAYGLFMLGSLFSQSLAPLGSRTDSTPVESVSETASSIVTDAVAETMSETSNEGSSEQNTTENSTTDNSSDTTTGKVDNCTTDALDKEVEPTSIVTEDLVKTATIIYFKPDRYALDEQAVKDLKPFIETALAYKDMPIVIEGHSGTVSEITADDESLAKKRAESIKLYLVSQKIAPSRILITSLVGTSEATKNQQDVWKTMRAEIYFQGYALEK